MIRNSHFYGQNASRQYPVDDGATAEDDAGGTLPADLVVDLNLRWPVTLGRYAFLAAVAATDGLVTVTVQAADAPDAVSGFTPLAAVSVRRPVEAGRAYALLPQADGVGGWVVFGGGAAKDVRYRGRFSSPAQSRLTPRAARAYRPLPVKSLQALHAADRLTGVVTLRADPPLVVRKEEREIEGVLRDCIVVSLTDSADGFAPAVDADGNSTPSVFRQFAGPCAGRPEAGTCGCPEPIQFVNAVPPDCDGLITIEFTGCAAITQVAGGGVTVECELGLVDACIPPSLPNSDGLLPSEATPTNVPVPPPAPPEPDPGGNSDSHTSLSPTPFVTCFAAPGLVPLTVVAGLWAWGNEDSPTVVCEGQTVPVSSSWSVSPSTSLSASIGQLSVGSYGTASAATRAVAVWSTGDPTTLYRQAVTECQLRAGPAGAKRNAALVVNYRESTLSPGVFVYHYAEVDYDTLTFRLGRFTGTAFQEVTAAIVPGILLDEWFKVTVSTEPGVLDGQTKLTARLESVTGPAVDAEITATVSNLLPANGVFGVGTNKALARFAYLTVADY